LAGGPKAQAQSQKKTKRKHLPRKDTEFHGKTEAETRKKTETAEAFATEGHGISRNEE
jgi:hypothetical protein